ncbi:hypothetical protein GCM10012279_27360 [Micromonospora yangpuensis]|nr:hypothetical protein GCM10012279_27360 [Micromonospora yangpuensis]
MHAHVAQDHGPVGHPDVTELRRLWFVVDADHSLPAPCTGGRDPGGAGTAVTAPLWVASPSISLFG